MASERPKTLTPWPPLQRAGFRFSFLYLVISGCFWIFEFADKSLALLAKPYLAIWHPIVQAVGHHLFHWTGSIEPSFVRDTRYLYTLLFCLLVFSVLATLVWTLLDRMRLEYRTLHGCLRIFVRYVLAYLMLHYGMDKVFLLQFPAPSLARLTESFGDYSPSSLMWAFIGSSVPFTIFGGLAEISGALFLLFRRTTTLGALITFAVMLNVTVMDFSYDVSVKIFCLNLLLMALFLILPDVMRLVDFFFLNRPAQPALLVSTKVSGRRRGLLILFKACVILYFIVPLTVRDWKNYKTTGAGTPRPALYGLYAVDDFKLNGISHPPLLTDNTRWRYVIFDTPGVLTVKRMDDSLKNYPMQYDAASREIVIDAQAGSREVEKLELSHADAGHLLLIGSIDRAAVAVTMHEVDKSRFTLINRGFHWVNETSFVR